MPSNLNATEASKIMKLTPREVSLLCRQGLIKDAKKEKGRWIIPEKSVDEWLENNQTTIQHKQRQERQQRIIPRIKKLGTGLATIVAILAIVSILADWGGARTQLQRWGILSSVPAASEEEYLIVIAPFHISEGVIDTELHNEIKRRIEDISKDIDLSKLRVEIAEVSLDSNERKSAEIIGKRSDANVIVWGSVTGARIVVNYLNLNPLPLPSNELIVTDIEVTETEAVQLLSLEDYHSFTVSNIPAQISFLSLFTIGQLLYSEGEYNRAIQIIEQAIGEVALDLNEEVQGLANAYLTLGVLHYLNEDYDSALERLNDAEELDRRLNLVYLVRADIWLAKNQLGLRIANLNRYIERCTISYPSTCEPELLGGTYFNRGLQYYLDGFSDLAEIDYLKSIELDPSYWGSYYELGNIYSNQEKFEEAIEMYTIGILESPTSNKLFVHRGNAHQDLGEFEKAIQDYTTAIEIAFEIYQNPNPALIPLNNRGLLYLKIEEYDAALEDFNVAIESEPRFYPAYLSRARLYMALGNKELAIQDFETYLELYPTTPNRDFVIQSINELNKN
ncbi:tetratricopeptide repeat protein [Candidatus Leptofilum sp.]|uniref:tetratricopeptide repeat protein n=1 Tax=Candidatus Leptofilum sp. TaxID=3241576 RepID=UPI003B5A5BAB